MGVYLLRSYPALDIRTTEACKINDNAKLTTHYTTCVFFLSTEPSSQAKYKWILLFKCFVPYENIIT